MSSQAFTRNHSDHSNDTGFQFEFFCDKCGNGHRSNFKHNALGVAASIIKAAGALFGGRAYRAGWGADHIKDALRGPAWDSAFKEAIEECRPRFRQCTQCGKWVCPEVCWNEARGLCEGCAPDLSEQAPMIQARVAVEQAWEQARQGDQLRGADLNSAPQRVGASLECAHCRGRLPEGARFCAQCGTAAVAAPQAAVLAKFCSSCGHKLDPTARFCASCGASVK